MKNRFPSNIYKASLPEQKSVEIIVQTHEWEIGEKRGEIGKEGADVNDKYE